MDTVRIALIGVGNMTQRVHLPSLASFDDVEIAACVDLDSERLAKVTDRYGIGGRYSDYAKMVEEVAPDGVYAVGQPHLMYDIWVWCLQRGLPLYIEKPMGLTRHHAQMLAHLADRNGVITQVSHQRRTSPLLVAMRDACVARGPITHAMCEFYKFEPQPALTSYDRMLGDCVHAIDTVRWICGGEVVAVESRCKRVGVPDINWITATLHFDNDASGVIVNSWNSGRRVFRVEMHAPGICCDADPEGEATLYADNGAGEVYDTRVVAGSDDLYVYGGFRAKNREFVDSLRLGREVTSSPFRDCLKTMEVAEQILGRAVLRGE